MFDHYIFLLLCLQNHTNKVSENKWIGSEYLILECVGNLIELVYKKANCLPTIFLIICIQQFRLIYTSQRYNFH